MGPFGLVRPGRSFHLLVGLCYFENPDVERRRGRSTVALAMEDPMQGYDELVRFEAEGAPPLPAGCITGYVEHDGARIWYASYGAGPVAILLHGGHGNAGNWGFQVLALVAAGYTAVVGGSRGRDP